MRVAISEDVIYQPLGDEVVLLNVLNQKYYGLNDIGAEMWRLLAELGDPEAVTDRLAARYDVDRSRLAADVTRLVGRLAASGLIETFTE